MKKLILTIFAGCGVWLVTSCDSSRQSASADLEADTTEVVSRAVADSTLPFEDEDRTAGSVSPRSEDRENNYTGVQGPSGTNVDTTLGPVNDANTRSYDRHVVPYNNGGGNKGENETRNPGSNLR